VNAPQISVSIITGESLIHAGHLAGVENTQISQHKSVDRLYL